MTPPSNILPAWKRFYGPEMVIGLVVSAVWQTISFILFIGWFDLDLDDSEPDPTFPYVRVWLLLCAVCWAAWAAALRVRGWSWGVAGITPVAVVVGVQVTLLASTDLMLDVGGALTYVLLAGHLTVIYLLVAAAWQLLLTAVVAPMDRPL